MKYNLQKNIISPEERRICNAEIIRQINGLGGTRTAEEIFNEYTGKGGLHGLSYDNFSNYSAFSREKKRIEQGQFFTPPGLVSWILDILRPGENDRIADLCCGHGAFCNDIPQEANFYGCDIDESAVKVANHLFPQAHICCADIREYAPGIRLDYVIGNPPFGLRWRYEGEEYASEQYYFLKAARLLKPGGIAAAIVPEAFYNDDFKDQSILGKLNENYRFVAQIRLDSRAFAHLGVVSQRTKLLILQKRAAALPEAPFRMEVIEETDSARLYHDLIYPLRKKKQELRARLFLDDKTEERKNERFAYSVRKLLYDIGRHPKTRQYLADCNSYVETYQTQKRPEGMSYEEWEKKRIHKADVLQKLRDILRRQNPKRSRKDRLIKDGAYLRYNDQTYPISSLVQSGIYPFADESFAKLLRRKRRQYSSQTQPFAQMQEDPEIAAFLDDYELGNKTEQTLFTLLEPPRAKRLNARQKRDINRLLQKRYAHLQWEQGSGKTLAGYVMLKYRMQFQNVQYPVVLGTANSIDITWSDFLREQGEPYVRLTHPEDLARIRPGTFLLLTFEMLCKYAKRLRRLIGQRRKRTMLVFDEADNACNLSSQRTRAAQMVFGRLKYKLLMTGTATRNTIAELFSQIWILYNASYNCISTCRYLHKEEKDGEDASHISSYINPYYGFPIPPYKKGFTTFTRSHTPEKITVFGISAYRQDVYNKEELERLLGYMTITRSLEEIAGRRLYTIEQVPCAMNAEERRLYRVAMEKFYQLEYLFKKTGNTRKDAGLRLLRQLCLLLKLCAAPQTLKEYHSEELPGKFIAILHMLEKFGGERVAIGVRSIPVAKEYAAAIRRAFPDRPLFLVTGDAFSIKRRKQVISDLEGTRDGILLSTQQCYSESVNIPFVNKVIIPELFYNNAAMSQYYGRFIRFDSREITNVYFVNYQRSIEANLLKMILVKDQLTSLVKNVELNDRELYEKFGIGLDFLSELICREQTKDGYQLRCRWGEQTISA